VGVVAKQQIGGDHQGQIVAVFDRSFYVETATGLFCVGLHDIGCGPLNALLAFQYSRLPFTVRVGERVQLTNHKIMLDGDRVLDATAAHIYCREASSSEPNAQVLQRNRDALRTVKNNPTVGFFWLLDSSFSHTQESTLQLALRKSTSTPLNGLVNWLRESFYESSTGSTSNHDASAVQDLLGAGPGLTPAGDDLIAGVMLALYRFQRADLANQIWEVISVFLATHTHPISAAHLEQAAKGHCGESIDALLNEIFHGELREIATISEVLNSVGCTSGWDTLGGVVIVIDAWQHSLIKKTG
jgi:hypothetical protein